MAGERTVTAAMLRTDLILALLPGWIAVGALAATTPPPGSVLVEAESFTRCEWYRLDEPAASGGGWLRSNQPEQVAGSTVNLPSGNYTLWVRCTDNGHYPGHYQYRVTVNGEEHWAGGTEPLAYTWCWERLGAVAGGAVSLRIDRADRWNTGCDCFLFVPDPACRPAGEPCLRLLHSEVRVGRAGGTAEITFEAPEAATGECWVALRRERRVVWSREIRPLPDGQPGDGTQRRRVACRVPAQRFAPAGRYELSLELGDLQWLGREEGDHTVADVRLGPLPTPRPVVAQVRRHQGTPTLFVDGKPLFAFAFLGVHTGHYTEFAAQGAHLYCVGCGMGNQQPGGFDAAEPNQLLQEVLARDPAARLILRVQLEPPAAWLAAHADERVVFDDGSVGPQSFASQPWLDQVCGDLRQFVAYLRSSPFADRVIGLHLCTGYSAEWQSWGLWDDRRGDFSPAFARFFRRWLRGRYRTDAALAAAWDSPEVTFDTAAVPSRSRRDRPAQLLWGPRRDCQVTDFYEAYALAASQAIARVARAVKEASRGEMLAGVFYGYAPQYGGLAPETQHLALREVLECADVDFLCAPAMYTDRAPGGTSTFMSLTDSVRLHGKLWLNESDIRTHLQADAVGRCADLAQTMGVLKREYAAVRSRGAGQWWFDMGDGWFADPAILSLFAEMNRLGQQALQGPPPPAFEPQIAVLLSERSLFRQAAGAMGDFGFKALTAQVAALNRVGAPAALYLLEDIERLPDVRMVVLLNAVDLTASQRNALERLRSAGRVIVFVYASGLGTVGADGRVSDRLDAVGRLTGQPLRAVEAGPFRVRLTDDPLCAGLRTAEPVFGMAAREYGPDLAASPRFVVDGAARVLGRFADGGPALALRAFPDWTSVCSLAPGLPPGLLRNLARLAGVHIYSESEDAFYAGRGTIALHAHAAGEKTIVLPAPMFVRELFAPGAVEQHTQVLRFQVAAAETKVFQVAAPTHRRRNATKPP
ncbi:MAG: hypothetical protein HYU66_10150 [Armatimonadetes bacterium]|nr:hypothetical protein [Armatimonadota bacterium]